MNVIEIKNFTKYYGRFKAIDDITLNVKESTITSFVGKNGAGKTTTINAIMNNIFPTKGEIKVLGLDVTRESTLIKENISFMPSDINYYENLNTLELIKYVSTFKNYSPNEALMLADEFELNIRKKIKKLSLGNKKKVAQYITF